MTVNQEIDAVGLPLMIGMIKNRAGDSVAL